MININNRFYTEDFKTINERYKFSTILKNKSILITGSTGLVGSCFVDFIMYLNKNHGSSIKIMALGRSQGKLNERFNPYLSDENFKAVNQDVCEPLNIEDNIDFIVHAASNADPKSFSNDPVGTMNANLIGTMNILNIAKEKNSKVVFVSTTEVYGVTPATETGLTESDYGIIDCNSLRACYPESKRAAETLCHCYSVQHGVDMVIARLCYIYGPTMTSSDSRVIAQFTRKVLAKENIIMKSAGSQKRSYCYVTDAVAALLYTMVNGKNREAYNISNQNSHITIREIADLMASHYNLQVEFENPDDLEQRGYSKQGNIIVNPDKLNKLGWEATLSMAEGIKNTIDIMSNEG